MNITIDQPAAPAIVSADLDLPKPYLLFLGDASDTTFLKTGLGLRDWAPGLCIAEHKCKGAEATLGLPVMAPREAYAAGARAIVLSAAAIGGAIREAWIPDLVAALAAGLDIISGAQVFLKLVAHARRPYAVTHP